MSRAGWKERSMIFLRHWEPGAVLNTQTAIAAVRNENEQIETEYVVTIWYE